MDQDNSKFDELVEDYAVTPVPEALSTNGLKVGLINSTLCLTLPSMVVGAELSMALGFKLAISACLIASAMLVLLGTLTGQVGSNTKVSTYVILRFPFGNIGASLISLVFAFSMFGWFGINIALFGQAGAGLVKELGATLSPNGGMIIGGLLITVTGIFGFKALDILSLLLVPVLGAVVVLLYLRALEQYSVSELMAIPAQDNILDLGAGISMLVGGMITICTAQPDLTRYTRTLADSFWAVFLPFSLAQPFVIIGVGLGAIAYQDSDVIGLLLKFGLGLWAFLMIISSSWIGNAINLYGCSLSLATVIRGIAKWKLVVVTGIAGTIAGLLGIMDHIAGFLVLLSVIVSPVAGIYILDFFWFNRGHYAIDQIYKLPDYRWRGLLALLIGVAVGFITMQEILQITTLPSLDALLSAMLVYGLLSTRVLKVAKNP